MRPDDRYPGHRQRRHIQNGGRAFLPQDRMRHIRWEEAVARSEAKRTGNTDPSIRHFDCHCGSIECLGVPTILRA